MRVISFEYYYYLFKKHYYYYYYYYYYIKLSTFTVKNTIHTLARPFTCTSPSVLHLRSHKLTICTRREKSSRNTAFEEGLALTREVDPS